ncbi:MAG: hypothetical protein ABIN58_13975, partial [candidate division WOR-3 bacterium]
MAALFASSCVIASLLPEFSGAGTNASRPVSQRTSVADPPPIHVGRCPETTIFGPLDTPAIIFLSGWNGSEANLAGPLPAKLVGSSDERPLRVRH